jgi:hypothetical protein
MVALQERNDKHKKGLPAVPIALSFCEGLIFLVVLYIVCGDLRVSHTFLVLVIHAVYALSASFNLARIK